MKTTHFNLCKECIHINSCVLTDLKSNVFSCSEYDGEINSEPDDRQELIPIELESKEMELEMAM